ncbi:MAG: hypothetical protein HYZ45_01690, partial [Burkholderiales bacterium]|nr:hypothetical protein [Burkholderiales bacterium]
YFVAAILLASRVTGVRAMPERPMYIVNLDASKECHLKWTAPNFVISAEVKAAQASGGEQVPVMFGGAACFEMDVFKATYWPLQAMPKIGDILYFDSINSYSLSWNTSFNGVPLAQLKYVK